MGYSIEPVEIWQNGESQTGNWIDASIVNDNLSDYAQFYWAISNLSTITITYTEVETVEIEPGVYENITVTKTRDEEVKKLLNQGNTTISGEAYVTWGSASDVHLTAYQCICEQLHLTLI